MQLNLKSNPASATSDELDSSGQRHAPGRPPYNLRLMQRSDYAMEVEAEQNNNKNAKKQRNGGPDRLINNFYDEEPYKPP